MLPILKIKDFTPSLIPNLSDSDYHGDLTAIGSSKLKTILKSPMTFKAAFEAETTDTEAFRFGRMFHEALLQPEVFASKYVIEPNFGDGRTKAAKDAKAEFLASIKPGQETISGPEFERIALMVASVRQHPDAKLLDGGLSEVSGYYTDATTGIKCKFRADYVNLDAGVLIDVKTTARDATPDSFVRDLLNLRYDFQLAMYLDGIKQATGKTITHAFYVVVEKSAPYECAIYKADPLILDKGAKDYRRALDLLSKCMDTNTWPAMQSKYEELSLPLWAIKD